LELATNKVWGEGTRELTKSFDLKIFKNCKAKKEKEKEDV